MKLVSLLAATAAAAALALVPGAAYAESKVHVDPTGDVVSFDFSSEDPEPTPAPARAESDLTSIRVTHLARSVRVAMTYRALNRVGLGKLIGYRVISNTGVREVSLDAEAGSWAGEHSIVNGRGDDVRCPGLGHRIDYVNDKVLLVIPRSCLGSPRWIRVAAYSATFDQGSFFVDDPRSSNPLSETTYYGPRVRRG